jgi:hypothetical protein
LRRWAEVAKTKAEEDRLLLEGLRRQERWLIVSRREDGKIMVFNMWRGRLKAWLLPSRGDLISVITLASMRGRFPAEYHRFEIYILEKWLVEKFHEVARPYEIKTQNEEV